MDRVRFGRALGIGAREAGKAIARAADAALADNPATGKPIARERGQQAGETVRTVRATGANVKRSGKKFGEAIWGPVARASGVLWLEVTGVFFGLFALTAAIEVWKRRANFRSTGEPRRDFLFAVGMLLVFGWFTASSFLRARKRARR